MIRLILVTLHGLVPALIVSLSMFIAHNIFIAMFLMHWCGMIPLLVIGSYITHGWDGWFWFRDYIKCQSFANSWKLSPLFFTAGCGSVVLGYIAMSCRTASWSFCFGSINENIANYGFSDAPLWLIIFTGIYFPTINPIIEELFLASVPRPGAPNSSPPFPRVG